MWLKNRRDLVFGLPEDGHSFQQFYTDIPSFKTQKCKYIPVAFYGVLKTIF
jgi:hypothetical protein